MSSVKRNLYTRVNQGGRTRKSSLALIPVVIILSMVTAQCNKSSAAVEFFARNDPSAVDNMQYLGVIQLKKILKVDRDGHYRGASTISWSPDGKNIAIATPSYNNVQIYSILKNSILRSFDLSEADSDETNELFYISEDKLLVNFDKDDSGNNIPPALGFLNLKNGSREFVMPRTVAHKKENEPRLGNIAAFSVSPDERYVAQVGQLDGSINYSAVLEDVNGHVLHELPQYGTDDDQSNLARSQIMGYPTALAFSPDSSRIAMGTSRDWILIFDTKSGNFISKFNAGNSACDILAYDSTGSFLAVASNDRGHPPDINGSAPSLGIWSEKSGVNIQKLAMPTLIYKNKEEIGRVNSLSWDFHSARLAAGGGGAIRVWSNPVSAPKIVLSHISPKTTSGFAASAYGVFFSKQGHLAILADQNIMLYR